MLEQASKLLHIAVIMGAVVAPGQPLDYQAVDTKRLAEAEQLAARLNIKETELPLRSLCEALRIRQNMEAGEVPSSDTVDVSTPDAQGRAQQIGLILAMGGQVTAAARIADRLPSSLAQQVYGAAISAAITATRFEIARDLLARFPQPEPNASRWRDETWQARLGLELARRQIAAGQTNEGVATLHETLRRLPQGPAPQSANVQLVIADVARLEAEMGLGAEALSTVVAASQRAAALSLFAPDVGRRLARSLGGTAAVGAARGAADDTIQYFVLVGIAQELSRPGLTDPAWRD